ncbi:hypothetical protein [Neobacillus mesonae]|uniref:hypothetical protein n=1 Tax=Neobacillus mesonae TaxID=1193713 RepID=UPI002573C1CC|nr:hypothetical protein [Neobacillus mesonae]
MKKKYLIFLFLFLFVATAALVVVGMFFNKTDQEKQNGLTNQYDISSQNTIAYVKFDKGRPQLYLYNKKLSIDTLVVEYKENMIILDPSFSHDGSTLAYITSNKDKEKGLESTVHFLDLRTKETMTMFTHSSVITEVEFTPDDSSLFYLGAGTFENYSPITGKRPHNFDVYQYDLVKKSHKKWTKLKQYSIHSLNVAPSGDRVYVQRDDDSDVKSAEDSFQVKQRIFEIPLDHPEEMSVISDPDREVDVFSFTITPNGKELIFQSISNADEGGTFEYELYKYNLDSKEEKQLTHFGEYVGDPVVSSDGKTIYFMLDKNFAKGDPDYHLYKMNIDGKKEEEIPLPNSGS